MHTQRIFLFSVVVASMLFAACTQQTKPSQPPTNEPASVQTSQLSGEPYVHPTMNYEIIVPENMQLDVVSDYSIQLFPNGDIQGQGPTNFLYVTVIPQDFSNDKAEAYNYQASWYEKLIAVSKTGESVSVADARSQQDEWYTYTRVDDVVIDGKTFLSFENTKPWEFPTGTTERRFLLEDNGKRYILGYYTGGETGALVDPKIALKVLQSIKLTAKTPVQSD